MTITRSGPRNFTFFGVFWFGLLGMLPLSAQWTGGPTGPIYYNGGNVGIGTTAPGATLHVSPSAAATLGQIITLAPSQTADALEVNSSSGSGGDRFRITPNGDIRFNNSGSVTAGIVVSGGNRDILAIQTGWGVTFSAGTGSTAVGIDFLTPIKPNTISKVALPITLLSGTTANALEINSSSGSNGNLTFINASGGAYFASNVGIGTTSPQHLLQVAGTIGAEEVIVSSTGADYVFGPHYLIEPLSKVADYIKQNHHLPGIPSAAEVKKKGVDLGAMQTKMLAKIEELTLHMIEADKTINQLKQQNRDLQEKFEKLEARGLGLDEQAGMPGVRK